VSNITSCVADPVGMAQMRIPTRPAGLLLGPDHTGKPVRLQLFRPRPTRIVLVDRGWVERVLVFRALALGSRVVVHTPTPQLWANFGEQTTSAQKRLLTAPQDQPLPIPASPQQPGLVVTEGPPLALPDAGPWLAQMTVAPWFGDYLTQAILDADLVLLRRLSSRELTVATAMLRIDRRDTAALQTTPDDGLVLYRPGSRRYVRLAPTTIEHQIFGQARAVF
jgi:hypothetical protein